MSNTELKNIHRAAPEITPASTWILTRVMIGAAATMTFTTFAYLLH